MKNNGYSIPDFIRLSLFEVRVEVRSQDFRQAGLKSETERIVEQTFQDNGTERVY